MNAPFDRLRVNGMMNMTMMTKSTKKSGVINEYFNTAFK